jgi:hypothetical protein
MSTDNIVLEHLRHIRAAVDGLALRVDEIISRIGHLERGVAQLHVQMADTNGRLDALTARVSRIETRLGLVEAAT